MQKAPKYVQILRVCLWRNKSRTSEAVGYSPNSNHCCTEGARMGSHQLWTLLSSWNFQLQNQKEDGFARPTSYSTSYRSWLEICRTVVQTENHACLWGRPPKVAAKSLCWRRGYFVSRHQRLISTKSRWQQCMKPCRATRSNQWRPNDRWIRWFRRRHPKSLHQLFWLSDVGTFVLACKWRALQDVRALLARFWFLNVVCN